jgi:hypothetical protein
VTWALLSVLVVTLAITLFWVFRLTVTVSKTSSNALASLISFDQRAQQERESHRTQVQGLIDRLMSGDWEAVRLHEGAAETEEGGFFAPSEQTDEQATEILPPRASWGTARTAQERADLLDEVESLAAEDDLDGKRAESELLR